MSFVLASSYLINHWFVCQFASTDFFDCYLKGQCHKDFAVFSQFCVKIITLRL